MRQAIRSPWLVVLVVATMLTVTFPAMATHNSVGTHLHVVESDEVDVDTGDLNPDVPHPDHPHVDDNAEASPYDHGWHHTLDDPRPAPIDQTGDRYTSCRTAADAGAEYDPANNDGDCYIGYIDQILEYNVPTAPLLVTWTPSGSDLYPVNPNPEDDYCRGQDEGEGDPQEFTGNDDVDTEITSLTRVNDDDCQGDNEGWYLPGDLHVDTSLAEAPQEAIAQTALGTDMGSGSYSLGAHSTTSLLIFGEPHPDAVNDPAFPNQTAENAEDARWKAGEGPFSTDISNLGSPFFEGWGDPDTNAPCGDRTDQCKLLTPADVKLYDPWNGDDTTPEPDRGRICAFIPQLTFAVAGDDGTVNRDQGVCGNSGYHVDEFIPDTELGGLGVDEGPPTWVTNLPSWSWGVLLTRALAAQYTGYAGAYMANEGSPATDDNMPRPGFITYWAVNPMVPTPVDDLRCIIPNILTDDDGVYGDYLVDGIDVDVYPNPFRDLIEPAYEATQPSVRSIIGPVQDTAVGDQDLYKEITDPEHAEAHNLAGDVAAEASAALEDELRSALPDDAVEAIDRANYTQSERTPAHAQPGDDKNQHPFDAGISAGLACDNENELRHNGEAVEWDAGLRFEASLSQFTTNLKDPTVLDEDLLPVKEEDTGGTWQVDLYSFSGQAQAVIDFTQNGAFDPCPGTALNPGEDLCPWESLWDAHSEERCENNAGKTCEDILRQRGYDVDDMGVGGYFVLKATGPLLVTSSPIATDDERVQEQTMILGQDNPTAQNCLVGVTIGFEDFIHNHFDGADDMDGVTAELCSDADGESAYVLEAFSEQDGSTPGTFNAQVSWAPLAPTPDAAGFSEDDSLCVAGIWSIQEDIYTDSTKNTTDTAGTNNINLGDQPVYEFADWQSLETGLDADGDGTSCR